MVKHLWLSVHFVAPWGHTKVNVSWGAGQGCSSALGETSGRWDAHTVPVVSTGCPQGTLSSDSSAGMGCQRSWELHLLPTGKVGLNYFSWAESKASSCSSFRDSPHSRVELCLGTMASIQSWLKQRFRNVKVLVSCSCVWVCVLWLWKQLPASVRALKWGNRSTEAWMWDPPESHCSHLLQGFYFKLKAQTRLLRIAREIPPTKWSAGEPSIKMWLLNSQGGVQR